MLNIFNNESLWNNAWDELVKEREKFQVCKRCILDASIPSLSFNHDGVCNYCEMQDDLEKIYPGGNLGRSMLEDVASKIKLDSKKKPYDVIVGLSGGADSSYLLHLAKVELGLRVLAVHFDNSWNDQVATENVRRVTKALDIDLYTHVVNNKEYDDLTLSFLRAGIPDIDMHTDLGFAATLRQAAIKYKVKYIFEGHSFRTEGVSPASWAYMDARYLNDVHKKYGTKKLKTIPQMWLSSQIKWMIFNNIKKIRPLWYIDYNKEQIKKMLTDQYGWQWYGGHHLENKLSAFFHSYFMPRRWGIDQRANGFVGMIRSNQMTREDASSMLSNVPDINLELVDYLKKRLNLTNMQFEELMMLPKTSYKDFKNYKKTFEFLRPFFFVMAKLDRIPWSFYNKYTKKDD